MTWGGPVGDTVAEADDHLAAVAAAGATWAVCAWPESLEVVAEAAAAVAVGVPPEGERDAAIGRVRAPMGAAVTWGMEFRRINGLPPYVFATINDLKAAARHDGRDVIDMGFGNPDLPSPDVAVEKLAEAARNPRNHRYSASRGIPKIRQAICDLYLRKFDVELDPETEVVTTIGAKEGLSHLMWVLVGSGRHRAGAVAVVPDPHLRPALRRGRHPPRPPRHPGR